MTGERHQLTVKPFCHDLGCLGVPRVSAAPVFAHRGNDFDTIAGKSRRRQRTRLNWNRMDRLITKWLPPARVRHPFPDARFDARIQGRSPVR